MWRLFPNIPKAVRGNWNSNVVRSAPPTACHDDDAVDTYSSQKASPVFFIHSNLCCYRAGKRGKKKKFNDKSNDAAWDKWIKSFKQNWNSMDNPFILEAFGYGTVLLLGIHLSQYYKLWHEKERRRYNATREQTWLNIYLSQIALALPVVSWESLKKLEHEPIPSQPVPMLEKHELKPHELKEEQQKGRKPKEKNKDKLFDSLELITAPKWLDKSTQSDLNLLKPDVKICSDDLLVEVEKEWSELNDHYISMSRNIAAYQYTQQGDMDRAVYLWHQSSNLASSSFNLGVCYELGRGVEINMEKSCKFYEAAASQGHHKAMYNLARIYLSGNGITQDIDRATELLKVATSANLSKALCDLGVLYASTGKEKRKAVELFTKAAKLKDMNGFYNLAVCYHTGCGIQRNLCQAAELYREAAQHGHPQAQLMLAVFFHHGLGGLPMDEESAKAWYEKAVDQLDELDEWCFCKPAEEESHFVVDAVADPHPVNRELKNDMMKCEKLLSNVETLTTEELTSTTRAKTRCDSELFDKDSLLAELGLSSGSFGMNIPRSSSQAGRHGNTKHPISKVKWNFLPSHMNCDTFSSLTESQCSDCNFSMDVAAAGDWNFSDFTFKKCDSASEMDMLLDADHEEASKAHRFM